MKNFGITGAAAMRGFLSAKEHRENRKISLEEAMLKLESARRTGELEKYIADKKYDYNAADRANAAGQRSEELGVKAHPGNLKAVEYRDTAAKNANEIGVKSHPGNVKAIGYRDSQAQRQEQVSAAQQPFMLKGIQQQGKMANDQFSDYTESRDYWTRYQNVQNALGNFKMTGDPTAIEDAYSMFDDGVNAKIVKHEAEGNKPVTYTVYTDNGQPPVEMTQEELYTTTEKIFNERLYSQFPVKQYGIAGGGGGMGGMSGMGGFGGMPGRNVAYKDLPASVKTNEYLIQAMRGMPQYAKMSPNELRMAAWALQSTTKDNSPASLKREFFVSRFEALTKPSGVSGRPLMTPEEAWKQAAMETQQYSYEYLHEGKPTTFGQPTAGDNKQDEIDKLIQNAINGGGIN